MVVQSVQYRYDMFGPRIAKQFDDNGDASIDRQEHYVYDGEHIALQFDSGGDLTHRYLHGPAVDQILADEQLDSSTATNNILWPLC